MTLTKEWAETGVHVIRWARENGWTPDAWPGHYRCDEFRLVITAEDGWVRVSGYNEFGFTRDLALFRVTSPQQAIDVLAALNVIPARFSSQWQAGRDYALTAAAVLLPDLEPVPEFVDGYHVGSRA